MRIIFFAGKGGVGKTSIAAATGMKTAEAGKRTIVLSLDIAHSLSDVFDLHSGEINVKPDSNQLLAGILDQNKGRPVEVMKNLYIQELDIQEEIRNNWAEIHGYLSRLFAVTGMDDILADEFAVLPGMEEVSLLLYVNKYIRESAYEVIILDCAPTGESIRFMSIPSTLDWYMRKLFRLERNVAKLVRPLAKRMTDIPLPGDEYFEAVSRLFDQLNGVDKILTDPTVTTVRLVTNPEKIVLKETQRAYMYFSLYRAAIDAVIVNRIYPDTVEDPFFASRMSSQKAYLNNALEMFTPVPVIFAPLMPEEVLGRDRLDKLGDIIYDKRDPAGIYHDEPPFIIEKNQTGHDLRIALPFASKEEIEIKMASGELFIRLGGFKKQMILPGSLADAENVTARMAEKHLIISFSRR